MEHEKCYLYNAREKGVRPSKKRRVEKDAFDSSLQLRKSTFVELWKLQKHQLDAVVHEITSSILTQIQIFTLEQSNEIKLPVGFVTTGSSSVTNAGLFKLVAEVVEAEAKSTFVSITATEASNLKLLLKNVIGKVVNEENVNDDEEDTSTSIKRPQKLLSYDLQRLYEWCMLHKTRKIVIALQNIEAFDITVLTDFLILLKSWKDRIPVLLLFGIATSIELFEDRLPRAALRCMSGRSFEVSEADDLMEAVFKCSVVGEVTKVRLGAALSDKTLQRQQDFTQSIEMFTDTLKYAYMCHFHGNPLSVFLRERLQFHELTPPHFEGIRNLPSFRNHVEALLEQNNTTRVRQLLSSDEELFEEVVEAIGIGQSTITWMLGSIRVITQLRTALEMKTAPPFSTFYIKALKGELLSSPILREVLLLMKRVTSEILSLLLPEIIDILMTMPASSIDVSPDDFRDIHDELNELVENDQASIAVPLRTEHDLRNNALRSTVLAQKVESGKQNSNFSRSDFAYSELVSRLHDLLELYFNKTLNGIRTIFLNEVLFYDLRASHTEVFTPRPRFAIERALSSPYDYLGCSCCVDTQDTLTPSHPPTAILYQLYLESGALINTMDLWSAFSATISEQYEDEETRLALFMRGLAELKHMGMIKQSRKKVDHLAKLSWKGL